MIISGLSNSQNYSFFNISQSSNEKAPETSRTDKYTPSANNNSAAYNMFGSIQKNIFNSFAGENSFMSAIREVFDSIENKALSAKDLVDAAAESEEFEKKGSWLTESEDKKLAVIRKAENVYYDGNAKTTVVLGSKNAVINTVNGDNKDTYIFGSENVITNSGNGNDYARISGSNNVIVNSGDGNDSSMVSNSQNVIVNGENGNDTIEVYVSTGIILDGGSGKDIINVTVSEDIIANGGDGADQIAINFSNNAMVDGGDGDDTITINASTNTIVYGGAGNDTITASGIISGGTGDDYIKLARSLFLKDENIQDVIQYSKGDGNDIVEGVTEDTIIELNGISEDEYDITESRNENGTKVKTLTMKDGSGSITMIYNGSTYSNHVKKQD